jgi:hypothetical protein
VLAPKGIRNVYEIDVGKAKTQITVMFTFGASGEVTPPMIIYPYKRLPAAVAASVPKEPVEIFIMLLYFYARPLGMRTA